MVRILVEQVKEGIGLHVVIEAKRGEILPLGILAENVGDEDVLLTALIECMDEGATDKASAAGDKDGGRHEWVIFWNL